jgi:F-type H+-transporting ATPase subunit gamma
MANIKELKKKIKSTQSTLKITTAMKLVSAAKLSKAQQAIQGARPYANELDSTIKTVSALVDNYDHPYFRVSDNKHLVMLVISSDKGLCGGYNSQLAKKVKTFVQESDENIKLVFIGKKVKELVNGLPNIGKTYTFDKVEASYHDIKRIGQELTNLFKLGEVGKVYVAFNEFHSAISFDSKVDQLLPLSLDSKEKESLKENFPFDFKYEPSPEVILNSLLPETFMSNLWTSQLDALASEHGSRMASMDSATKNCKEMIRTLTLKMNKLRQAGITTELIEVVSGAESLKN